MTGVPEQLNIRSTHYSKKEKAWREEMQKRQNIGCPDFDEIPVSLKKNPAALLKWKKIIKLYKEAGITFITNADTDLLVQYCITYVDWIHLIRARETLKKQYNKNVVKFLTQIKEINLDLTIQRKQQTLSCLAKSLYLDPKARATISHLKNNKEEDKIPDDDLDLI